MTMTSVRSWLSASRPTLQRLRGLLLLAPLLSWSVLSASVVEAAPAPATTPVQVKVGVYVLSLGRLDTSSGAFTVDFFLTLRCDEPCDQVNFEFTNGRATSVDKLEEGPLLKTFRIQAALSDNLDYRAYPFDEHRLSIALEDKVQGSDQLAFVVDREHSGVDPKVTLAGWDLGGRWNSTVEEHYYPVLEKSVSQLIFHLPIKRHAEAAILKFLVPGLIFVACGFAALFVVGTLVVPRVAISTAALLGSVVFHLNTTSSLPPGGYLTFADRFMLVNYLGLFACLASTIMLILEPDLKREAVLRRRFLLGTPLVWVLGQALNALIR